MKKNADVLSKVTACVIFIIVVSYYTITIINSNNMDKQMITVREHPYIVTLAIGDIKANLSLMRALPERMIFSQNFQIIDGIKNHYQAIDKSMMRLIDTLRERYLADTENVPLLQKTYSELYALQEQLIDIADNSQGDNKKAFAFYEQAIIPKVDKLNTITAAINDGAKYKLQQYADLASSSRFIIFTMATILSAAVLLAVAFYLYLLKLRFNAEKETFAVRAELELEQRANTAKTHFLFNMSHDIRTPMNAIIGLTAIAAIHIDKQGKVRECLEKISSSSRHLLGLINDVLDMSRIESGKVQLNEDDFIFSDLIKDINAIILPQASERTIHIDVNIHNLTHERIIGDSVRIKQVLVNIVGNALKFTPPEGYVCLTIKELSPTLKGYGNYQFVIQDTGIGMSEEFLKKLFLPFERAETSTNSKVEGTGLGMAITNNIVNMMGGQIKVESAPEKGTTFTVTLPLKLQSGEDANFDFCALRDLRSLVVDDDIIACENTSRMIDDIGMRCEWVLSGAKAVEKIQEAHGDNQNYHVIIVDWAMPGMDGVETVRQIRKLVGDDLPIIFLTAYDWTNIEDEARASGVNAFLSKPVFKSTLYTVMHDLTVGRNTEPVPVAPVTVQKYLGQILLVEDNAINMEIAKEFMEFFGATVGQAWDGREALEMIKTAPEGFYDLIFMDIQMPHMNGYEATRSIRQFEAKHDYRPTPIVAMSANAFAEEIEKGYACGMDGYITKPVDFNKIQEIIASYLKSA